MEESEDGSSSVLLHDVDQMYGTKGIAKITLYPGRAYIEISGQLYNRTSLPQTFLWWANPAVPVNDNTRSVFPPDVHAVMDHGRRDVSRFPIATGVYYKHDYSEGVDISCYRNIPVPTSYMAEKSKYDFVGGFDYGKNAGILHVADHHISPGKKQWTWGCGDFGKAWDRNLTDEDGPYVELMTGVYTDNQPDFTWLKPFEEKTFRQYFMPYKAVGQVKNASREACVNLSFDGERAGVTVYATGVYENARILLTARDAEEKGGLCLLDETSLLSPEAVYERSVETAGMGLREEELHLAVYAEGECLVEYRPEAQEIPKLPEPAKAPGEPEEIRTNEELYLTGLHIEQYRHATRLPDPYYLEGLKRDPGDIRLNSAYGALLLRRGRFGEAETCFRRALKRMTEHNPNPYSSEACYLLGLSLLLQGEKEQAYDAFYKATWSSEQQEMSFYYLAAIDAEAGKYKRALEHVEKGLVKNAHNIKARGLKAYLLRRLGRREEAARWVRENLALDPFDFVSGNEQVILAGEEAEGGSVSAEVDSVAVKPGSETVRDEEAFAEAGDTAAGTEGAALRRQLNTRMRNFPENYLMTARDYAEWGAWQDAAALLGECTKEYPLLYYYRAFYRSRMGLNAAELLERGESCSTDYCFPNKLEDIAVLRFAIDAGCRARAAYYLGCLFYDRLQWQEAVALWEMSAGAEPDFALTHRNLALTYYNKKKDPEAARREMEKAFALNTGDARIFLELDQLYKKLGMSFEKRLENYEKHQELACSRDDLYVEYVTLVNLCGDYQRAYDCIRGRRFHPWEGGEGRVTTQYTLTLLQLARQAFAGKQYGKARELLEKALVYPENLGEGKLEGTKDNHIYYYLGLALEGEGRAEEAVACYRRAVDGTDEPAGAMFYNDQPADMILYQGLACLKLGETGKAKSRFYRLIDYGERHLRDEGKISYFAVSLPDFLIFDEDYTAGNRAHCYYLMALGNIGLGRREKAAEYLRKAAEEEPSHMMCRIYEMSDEMI